MRSTRTRGAAAILGLAMLVGARSPALAQTASDDQHDSQSTSLTPSGERPWLGALKDSFKLLMLEHAGRITFQEKTRRELGGPFFLDYKRSVKLPHTWNDGDGWFVNYIGHPIHGAASSRIWLDHVAPANVPIGFSKAYLGTRGMAALWAMGYSLQFEFGPLSEASIGNVGLDPATTGWVDHIVTPVGAFATTITEDVLDHYFVEYVERHTSRPSYRALFRVLFNPSRSLANLMEGRAPWFRSSRPLQ